MTSMVKKWSEAVHLLKAATIGMPYLTCTCGRGKCNVDPAPINTFEF